MLMTCCAYSCTQYGLHTQYMLLTHADDLLYLQLHTVLAVPTAAHSTQYLLYLQLYTVLAVPTAVHSTCCTYSCTQYSLHTQYTLLTHADDLLYLQLHTVHSTCCTYSCTQYTVLAVPTAAHSTVLIEDLNFFHNVFKTLVIFITLFKVFI